MNALKRFRIGTRLSVGFFIPVIFLVVNGVLSLGALSQLNTNTHAVYDDRVVPLQGLKNIADAYAVNVIDAVNKANAGLISANDAARDVAAARQTIQREWQAYMATTLTPEEARLAQEADRLFGPANQGIDRLESSLRSLSGNVEGQLGEFDGPLYSAIDPISEKITELVDLQLRVAKEVAEQADVQYRQAIAITSAMAVVAVVIAAFMGWWITRSITVPIHEAVALANTVASGDLTSQIQPDGKDETADLLRALKAMNDSLVKVVAEVRQASDSITTGSAEIATGNADLSARTEGQASSLEETAASMEELTATVNQNAETARQASQIARHASEAAEKGGVVVGQVVSTMHEISGSSQKIADIISVIDGIAFQTNILALNAAVEAARAGEQGRGFAVVAGEVRTLAQRSASAAKEIKELIHKSVERVQAGSTLVGAAGESVNDIVVQVRRVSDLIAEITAASHEQAGGINQIGDAVQQLDQVTQQNAALVEESAAAAESLKLQAARLSELVSVFKLAHGGDTFRPRLTATSAR